MSLVWPNDDKPQHKFSQAKVRIFLLGIISKVKGIMEIFDYQHLARGSCYCRQDALHFFSLP